MRRALNIHVTPLLMFMVLSAVVTHFDIVFNPPSSSDAETTLEKVVDGFLKLIISPIISVGITVLIVSGVGYLFFNLLHYEGDWGFVLVLVIAPITFFISLISSLVILLVQTIKYLSSLAVIYISWSIMVLVLGSIESDVLDFILNIEYSYPCYLALIIVLVVRWIYLKQRITYLNNSESEL